MAEQDAFTPEDQMEIEELISQYSIFEDRGEAESWASLFTADGAFVSGAGEKYAGREALVAFATRRWENPEVHRLIHWISNIVVTPTAEGATSQSYQMTVGAGAEGYEVVRLSGKDDTLRRENGRWRFLERRVVPLAEG